jgi:hypothetical protein
VLHPVRVLLDRLKRNDPLVRTVSERWMLYEANDPAKRGELLRIIFERLKGAGRLDPSASFQSDWETLERQSGRRFAVR